MNKYILFISFILVGCGKFPDSTVNTEYVPYPVVSVSPVPVYIETIVQQDPVVIVSPSPVPEVVEIPVIIEVPVKCEVNNCVCKNKHCKEIVCR